MIVGIDAVLFYFNRPGWARSIPVPVALTSVPILAFRPSNG
jgi:hypothetical protein